uniref:Activin_recp domain-containing protein n=1 Tax=Panagrellus redivivus TaxID=6233 RepID=A0A7E4V624_PANRE
MNPPNAPSNSLTFALLILITLSIQKASAIQCYSGSQLQILECPSVSCIKQSLGLDTVRYCDGTGVSSICQTYRIFDSCQNIPNLGYICCCSDQLCNGAKEVSIAGGLAATVFGLLFARYMA